MMGPVMISARHRLSWTPSSSKIFLLSEVSFHRCAETPRRRTKSTRSRAPSSSPPSSCLSKVRSPSPHSQPSSGTFALKIPNCSFFFAALRAAVRIRHRRTATGEERLQSVNMVSIVAELDGCWAAASAGPLPTALHAAAAWQRRQAGCGGGWRLDGAERLLVPCAELCRPLLSGREPRVWPACFARLWSCSAARRRLRLSPVPALSTGGSSWLSVWDALLLARAHGLTGRRCPDKKMNVQ